MRLPRILKRTPTADSEPDPSSLEAVAERAGDDLYLRHLLFIRFVLGERLVEAAWMARHAERNEIPLSIEDMRYMAVHWHCSDDEHERCPSPPKRVEVGVS